MGLFDSKEYLEIIEKQEENEKKLIDIIAALVNNQTPPNPHPDWATGFKTAIFYNGLIIQSNKMSIQILDTQSVTYKITPVKADGTQGSIAPGSGLVASSDTTLFTVVPDATDPSGLSGKIVGVAGAVGVGKLNVSGNADTTGATTVTIVGSDDVGVNAPPPANAVGFTFSYGTPV